MARPKPYQNPEMTGQERVAAIARLLALGIVRLASREQARKERDRTGLQASSKHVLKKVNNLKRKGK